MKLAVSLAKARERKILRKQKTLVKEQPPKMPKSTTGASFKVMNNSKSATGASTESTSNEKAKRQQSLSDEIRRLSSLAKEQVNGFRQEVSLEIRREMIPEHEHNLTLAEKGVLKERLHRQAANLTSITDPLAQSIDEGTSKGHQLAELQQKYEELAEQLRSKDLEIERLREKVKNANNVDRPILSSSDKVQKQEIREKRRVAKSESKERTPAVARPSTKSADDSAGQDAEPIQPESSTEGVLPTAPKPCRIMPGFTRLPDEIYPDFKDPHANLRIKDIGAELRMWYKQLPKPKKRIHTVAYLTGKQGWIVSAIADLPKAPGLAAEDDEEDATSEEHADMEGHASSDSGKALQQDAQDHGADDRIRPLKFSLKVVPKSSSLPSSSSAGAPLFSLPARLTATSSKIAASSDQNSPHSARRRPIIKQEAQTLIPAPGSPLLPPRPLTKGRDTRWDPRHLSKRVLISSASSTNTPRTKRPRSPSPERQPPKGAKR